jgi:ribose transport system permease protein
LTHNEAESSAITTAAHQDLPPEIEQPGEARSRQAFFRRAVRNRELPAGLALIALVAGFWIARPAEFGTVHNFVLIATDSATILVMAVGMTFVIITGGIDLSVGSVLVFSGVIADKAMAFVGIQNTGPAIVIGLAAALAAGALWGSINGVLVAHGRLQALIVTLATYGAALGLSQIITNGVDLDNVPSALVTSIGIGGGLGIPWLVWIAAATALAGEVTLRWTRFGLRTYALGSSAEAARRAGVRVERRLITTYVMMGVLSGLAGFLALAQFGTTTIAGHTTDNLIVITGVVIGGTSLLGGTGSVAGSVIGILISAVLENGLVIIGLSGEWQEVIIAFVLAIAVYLDRVRRSLQLRA